MRRKGSQRGLARFRPREGPKAARRFNPKELDRLCREVVFLRDGDRCRRCGSGQKLQWCHVYTRAIRSLRWDLDNSFCGCAGCHLWWHHKPTEAVEWWRSVVGEQTFATLRLRAGRPRKVEPTLIGLYLEQERARMLGKGGR